MLAYDLIDPEPTLDYALASILSMLHNAHFTGRRTAPADYSLRKKEPTPAQPVKVQKAILQGFAAAFNANAKKGVG